MGGPGLPGRRAWGRLRASCVPSARSPSGWQHRLFLPKEAWATGPRQVQALAEWRAAAGLPGPLFLPPAHGANWRHRALSPRFRSAPHHQEALEDCSASPGEEPLFRATGMFALEHSESSV